MGLSDDARAVLDVFRDANKPSLQQQVITARLSSLKNSGMDGAYELGLANLATWDKAGQRLTLTDAGRELAGIPR